MDPDRNYKAIRFLGFFSLLTSAVFLVVWLWYSLTAGPTTGTTLAQLLTVGLALFGAFASNVASSSTRKADEIADLRRRLAGLQGGSSRA